MQLRKVICNFMPNRNFMLCYEFYEEEKIYMYSFKLLKFIKLFFNLKKYFGLLTKNSGVSEHNP